MLAARLAAQPVPAGREVEVDHGILTLPTEVVVAGAADGGFLGAWVGREGQILARAFTSDGAPRSAGPTVVRPPFGQDPQSGFGADPAVAALSGGGYAVAWRNTFITSSDTFVDNPLSFRLLDAAGQPAGPEIPADNDSWAVSLAATPTGGFVLAWSSSDGVTARRFDAAGAALGDEIHVSDGTWTSLSVAALPDGGFVITWISGTPDPGNTVQYRVFAADGTPHTPEMPLHVRLEAGSGLWISADGAGCFVIAWSEESTLKDKIFARLFGPDGAPLGPAIEVASQRPAANPFVRLNGDVAMRPDGSFLVVWEQSMPTAVLARAYNADGTPQGEAFPVPTALGAHFNPDAATAPSGWLVAWTGDHPYVRSFLAADCGGPAGLCLNRRFRVEAAWRVPSSGAHGTGTPIPRTGDTGVFWFFQPANFELLVKVLDGRGINGHFWVFYGSLTNVEFDLTVTDTMTGDQRTYHNPSGTMASRADTTAF